MRLRIALAALAATFIAGGASAATFGFSCITNNSATDCGLGEAQLTMDVYGDDDSVSSKFMNAVGGDPLYISDIYFDDQAGLFVDPAVVSITEGLGVDFRTPIPGNGGLPGGNTIGFDTTPATAEANNEPGSVNGVDPGEFVILNLALDGDSGLADVLTALFLGGDQSGSLRVGIHVQGFESGGSESYVNSVNVVPLPAAGWLLIAGLGGLAAYGRKKRAA